MSDEILDIRPSQSLARQDRSSVLLMPVMDVPTALARLAEFQAFCSQYLQESADGGTDGGDYGVIPGTKKKTLLKSGAEKLCEIYGLADDYKVMSSVENWETGLFDYTLTCVLKSRRDDSIVGTGVGSCSSFEAKYRWREQQKACPACGIAAIIKGKAEYGGGWLCWKKKGGCGATFKDGDRAIEAQPVGRVENPDIIDTKNTVLKMAKKRAKIDAVIGVTRSSGIFTQDLEDAAPPVVQSAPPARQEAPQRPPDQIDESMPTLATPGPQPSLQARHTPEKSPAGSDGDSRLISDPMRKRAYAISKAKGWTTEQLKSLVNGFGFSSSAAITRDVYDAVIDAIQKGPAPDTAEMPDADEVFN